MTREALLFLPENLTDKVYEDAVFEPLPRTHIVAGKVHLHHLKDQSRLRRQLKNWMDEGVTCGLLPTEPVKAVFFDFDATVIQQETLDVLAGYKGVADIVSDITAQSMRGELDFAQALKERLALLKGISDQDCDRLQSSLTLQPGLEYLCRQLRQADVAIYIVSGGFDRFIKPVATQLGATAYHCHPWTTANAAFTGALPTTIVDGKSKAQFVANTCAAKNWQSSDIAVIGDGFNDAPMMEHTTRAIGFHPKPKLIPYLHAANFTDTHDWLANVLLGAI